MTTSPRSGQVMPFGASPATALTTLPASRPRPAGGGADVPTPAASRPTGHHARLSTAGSGTATTDRLGPLPATHRPDQASGGTDVPTGSGGTATNTRHLPISSHTTAATT